MKKILIVNWTQRNNCAGGVETRMQNLHEALPNSVLISYETLFGPVTNYVEAAKKMTAYLEKRYEKDNNILVIRDAALGVFSEIPQITIWANPYAQLGEKFDNNFYREMSQLRTYARNTTKVTIGKVLIDDMKMVKFRPDHIIPEAIDINFWIKLDNKEELKKKHNIPKDKIVGIWTGINHPIKNSEMFDKMMEHHPDIHWIKILKEMNYSKEKMRELYNCADFFILTPSLEGGGLSWLEAMSCDLPCIVSDTGCFKDWWDDRIGIKIKYSSFVQHIKAIKNILDMKTNPRQVLIDRGLTLENWADSWRKLVEEVSKNG